MAESADEIEEVLLEAIDDSAVGIHVAVMDSNSSVETTQYVDTGELPEDVDIGDTFLGFLYAHLRETAELAEMDFDEMLMVMKHHDDLIEGTGETESAE